MISGVILTTAESKSESFENDKTQLEAELAIPIEIVLRNKLIEIMSEALLNRIKDQECISK